MTASPPTGLTRADERHHAVGDEALWNESWYFDFATTDGTLGGYVRIGLYPNEDECWYWACLVGEGRPLVTVVDHSVALPKPGSLELRGTGLWADHTVETAFDHMTLGCEAFALGVDDPAEMYGDPRGDRVPFGLDLEFDTDGGAYPYPGGLTRYEVPCTVQGEVLVGAETIPLGGPEGATAIGQRDHSWGVRDWWTVGWTWTSGWLDDGTRFHGLAVRLGDQPVPYHPGYLQAPGGRPVELERTGSSPVLGDEGLPTGDVMILDDLRLDIDPVAFAPVLLDGGEGRVSRFPRALCRFHDPVGGRTGVGWTEWNQPQPGG
jgi:hypothetical protein